MAMLGSVQSALPAAMTIAGARKDAASWTTVAIVTSRSRRLAWEPDGRGAIPAVPQTP